MGDEAAKHLARSPRSKASTQHPPARLQAEMPGHSEWAANVHRAGEQAWQVCAAQTARRRPHLALLFFFSRVGPCTAISLTARMRFCARHFNATGIGVGSNHQQACSASTHRPVTVFYAPCKCRQPGIRSPNHTPTPTPQRTSISLQSSSRKACCLLKMMTTPPAGQGHSELLKQPWPRIMAPGLETRRQLPGRVRLGWLAGWRVGPPGPVDRAGAVGRCRHSLTRIACRRSACGTSGFMTCLLQWGSGVWRRMDGITERGFAS